jgi:hypothetical protein
LKQHTSSTNPSLAFQENNLRIIVEAVHAGTCGEEDEDGNLPELLDASSSLVVPILNACVQSASTMKDKGLVIGCLQIMMEHSDMPENMSAFWRNDDSSSGGGEGGETKSTITSPPLLTLPVDTIRTLRSEMMLASLYMLDIAPSAADGLPGNVLEALCGVVPLSPDEWAVLAGPHGLLSTKLHVRRRCLEGG